MPKTACISCGAELKSRPSVTETVCINCRGNVDRGILAREYNYGSETFEHTFWKKKEKPRLKEILE